MSVIPQLGPRVVDDCVYQLSALGARVTAIEHDGDVLLVDTGARGSYPLVAGNLALLGLRLDRVRSIVLTHAHPDHAGALGALMGHTSASVVAHEDEGDALDTHHPAAMLPDRWSHRVSNEVAHRLFDRRDLACERVHGNTVLDWPDEIKVIHTPGHTRGSISLFIPLLRLVIVGDALQYRFRRLGGPARWSTGDYKQAIESLDRIVQLDFETIVFSHYPPLKRVAKDELVRLIEREHTGRG